MSAATVATPAPMLDAPLLGAAKLQCGIAACLLAMSPLLLAPALGADDEVIVSTRVVMASFKGNHTLEGPGTVSLKQSLRQLPYTSYRLLQSEDRPVRLTQMAQFAVPGGRHLLVQPTACDASDRVSLYVMLMHGQRTLVNTVLKLRNRGQFLVAGPRHEDGVLILSIGATTTHEASAHGLRSARDAQ